MAPEKQTSQGTTVVNQTTTPTPTAEETQLNQMNLRMALANESGQTEMQKNAYGLGNQLLTSFQSQNSPQWQSLIGGVNQDQQNSMANSAYNTMAPSFNQGGIMDSGTRASVMARSGADLYNANAQFNVGTLQNALNLALSGQAQVQSPALSVSSQLNQSLAGLRSTNTSGTTNSNQTITSMNPFMKSFQTGLGTGLSGGFSKMMFGG